MTFVHRNLLLATLAVLVSLPATGARAAESKNEITPSFQVLGVTGGRLGASLDAGSTSIFSLGGAYYGAVTDMVQVGGDINVLTASSLTVFSLLGGVNINLGDHLKDAFFINPELGLHITSAGSATSTNLAFGVYFGKRFEIVPHVAYAPRAGFYKVGDADIRFQLDFARFSFLF